MTMRKAYTPKQPSESQIQETCCAFLALDGWRRIRTDMKQLRGMGVQEPGMADDLFIRYEKQTAPPTFDIGAAQILWCEWKAKKGVHSQKQIEWQTLERARGALVWSLGIDFPASIEGFEEHYLESGLLCNAGMQMGRRKASL